MPTPTMPTGSYVMYESFSCLFPLLSDEDELAVRRAIDAYAYDKPIPDMSENACRVFEGIVPQLAANKKRQEDGKKGGRPKKTADTVTEVSQAHEPQVSQNGKPTSDEPRNHSYETAETSGFENQKTTLTAAEKPNKNVNENVNGNVNWNGNKGGPGGPDAPAALEPAPERPEPTGTMIELPSSQTPQDPDTQTKARKPRARATPFKPPSPEEVTAYAAELGHPDFDGARFCDYYESRGWMYGKTKIKDWKACVRTWLRKDAADSGPAQSTSRRIQSDNRTDWDVIAAEYERNHAGDA